LYKILESLSLTSLPSLSGALLKGRLLALPANIGLGWKGLPGTNALAYYKKLELTAVKSFITLAQEYSVLILKNHGQTLGRHVRSVCSKENKSYTVETCGKI
jgi:hypothetical protein